MFYFNICISIEILWNLFICSVQQHIKNYLCYSLSHSLELSAFFIQFLSWWHSENLQSKFIAYPVPDPPKVGFFLLVNVFLILYFKCYFL